MLYSAFEFGYAAMTPARVAAGFGARFWCSAVNPLADTWVARASAAALDVFENATRRYPKPEWDLTETIVEGTRIPVAVEIADSRHFCNLLHFRRDERALRAARGGRAHDPAVLIIAPL